jgi:hypothetical protein
MSKARFRSLRRGCHLQHPTVSAPEKLRPLAERSDLAQQAAAVSEQLLSFSGQDEPATDTIEKHEAELMFKIADLPGQSGLARGAFSSAKAAADRPRSGRRWQC